MGYKVKVYETTGALPSWLCHGKLVSERKATYYKTPGKAVEAASNYAKRNPVERWEIVHATTGRLHSDNNPQLKVTFNIDALSGGQFRVWSTEASVDTRTSDLPNMLSLLAKDWAEQVADDLGGSCPVDIFKLDMDKGE